jgi:transposase
MKQYPLEFMADMVALYESRPESTIKQIAVDPGVNPETLQPGSGTRQPFARPLPVR